MAKEREVLDRRWRQSIADIVRHGRETGEFPENGVDADELGLRIGAFIDGLAIQVLMNDTNVPPERMLRVCREVAASLIGFALEPAGNCLRSCGGHDARAADPRRRHRCRRHGWPCCTRRPRPRSS